MKPHCFLALPSSGIALLCVLTLTPIQAEAADARPIVAAKCAKCHGEEGDSSDPAIPRIAGLHPTYIARQMREFAEGRRRNEDMAPLALELGEDGVQAVSAWYGNKKPPVGKPGDPKLAEAGKQLYEDGNGDPAVQPCVACHQSDGAGNARFPRLAGQHKDYLGKQLSEFKRGRRATDPQMVTIAQRLSTREIKALAEYISGM